jgi:hypothetical protein
LKSVGATPTRGKLNNSVEYEKVQMFYLVQKIVVLVDVPQMDPDNLSDSSIDLKRVLL